MPRNDKNIHSGHRERMRKRFLQSGFLDFAEYEILEFLLYQIQPRCDTRKIALHLLEKFGNLQDVLSADCEELTKVSGVGNISAEYIVYLRKLFNAYQRYHFEKFCIRSVESRQIYFMKQLEFETREVFMIACLDDRMRIICCKTYEKQQLESNFYENMRMLIPLHCNQVIIAQNRLNGSAGFQDEDIRFAYYLKKRLEQLNIKLIDVILISKGKAVSMEEDTRL